MSGFEIYALAGAAVVGIALHGLIARRGPLRKLIALNVLGAGVFLIIVALAGRGSPAPDPVPHAMVLTGIVIAVSFTAFGVVLAVKIAESRAQVGGDDRGEEVEGGDAPGDRGENDGGEGA